MSLFTPLAVLAQTPTLPIATTDLYESFDPRGASAAPLASGGFAVLWSVGDDPFHLDVRLQYISPQGDLLLGAQGVPVADSIESESASSLVAARSGGVFAAYLGTYPHTAEIRVFIQGFDPSGAALWPEGGILPLEPPGRDVQREPRLLSDGYGGVFLCLTHDDGSSGVSREIVCQHLGGGGERLWGEIGRSAGGRLGAREQPSVVSDGRGGFLVFWLNRRDLFASGTLEPLLIEGQHFSADGRALWGEAGRLIAETGLPSSRVSYSQGLRAVPDGAGGAVLAYRGWSRRGAASDDVLALRINRDGRLLWRRPTSVLDGPEDQILTELIPTLDGGAIAVVSASAHDGAPLRLFRLAASGRQRWVPGGILLTDASGAGGQGSSRGAFDGQNLLLAWIERPGWPALRRAEMHLTSFNAKGRQVAGTSQLIEALPEGAEELALVCLDSSRRNGLTLWNSIDYGANRGQDGVGFLGRSHER